MFHRLENKNGLTLLEVLASIVILSIVIVSFFTLFSQMSLFNKKTEDNLDGITIAKELLVEMKYLNYTNLIAGNINLPNGLNKPKSTTENPIVIEGVYRGKSIKIEINKDNYIPNTTNESLNLHEMKIIIYEDKNVNTNSLSTIYGFMPHE